MTFLHCLDQSRLSAVIRGLHVGTTCKQELNHLAMATAGRLDLRAQQSGG